ncbi:MAG: hypothetical protein IJ830_06380 [Alphaproteobacteria bacterium]|nr:hypothetical protein [Alphaproteobacteria bacterium]
MYKASIDEELKRIALYIERMHNRLMDIYFSLENEEEKKKYQHLLGAAGRLYKALTILRD